MSWTASVVSHDDLITSSDSVDITGNSEDPSSLVVICTGSGLVSTFVSVLDSSVPCTFDCPMPTPVPTPVPSSTPTMLPIAGPTFFPTHVPSPEPSNLPTLSTVPTSVPTSFPTTSAPTITEEGLYACDAGFFVNLSHSCTAGLVSMNTTIDGVTAERAGRALVLGSWDGHSQYTSFDSLGGSFVSGVDVLWKQLDQVIGKASFALTSSFQTASIQSTPTWNTFAWSLWMEPSDEEGADESTVLLEFGINLASSACAFYSRVGAIASNTVAETCWTSLNDSEWQHGHYALEVKRVASSLPLTDELEEKLASSEDGFVVEFNGHTVLRVSSFASIDVNQSINSMMVTKMRWSSNDTMTVRNLTANIGFDYGMNYCNKYELLCDACGPGHMREAFTDDPFACSPW